jgi:hypothetical protein
MQMSPSGQQQRDVAGLIDEHSDQLDVAYLRRWAGELGVARLLDDVLPRPTSG